MGRPRISKSANRRVLLAELTSSLDEVDDLKRALRKAKSRVSAVMGKLDNHVLSIRRRRGKRSE